MAQSPHGHGSGHATGSPAPRGGGTRSRALPDVSPPSLAHADAALYRRVWRVHSARRDRHGDSGVSALRLTCLDRLTSRTADSASHASARSTPGRAQARDAVRRRTRSAGSTSPSSASRPAGRPSSDRRCGRRSRRVLPAVAVLPSHSPIVRRAGRSYVPSVVAKCDLLTGRVLGGRSCDSYSPKTSMYRASR